MQRIPERTASARPDMEKRQLQENKNIQKKEKFQQVRISVRGLVEFLLRSGDIDDRISPAFRENAMQEGARVHKKIQRSMGGSYMAEVPLSLDVPQQRYILTVEGRADGIFFAVAGIPVPAGNGGMDARIMEKEIWCIDEIKGVYRDVEDMDGPAEVHVAQAKCYAYIYALQHGLPEIGVQMTYCDLDTEEVRRFFEIYSFARLQAWFMDLIAEYRKWADFQYEWRSVSLASIQSLEFPYPYRPGQKELASDVYRTILRKKNLFIQAPTGVGKTLTVLYPAVRAMGEGLGEKIFYLTAKTVVAFAAMDTFSLLRSRGYRGKVVQITAKEKLCRLEKPSCNPDACPYAKGHYDRVNDAVYELLHETDCFSRDVLTAQADRRMVCPYETCLDLSIWCDAIVGDYNYVFDPYVSLKRFFGEGNKGDYIFLVDEAHNLVERGRQMYSASIVKEDVLAVKQALRNLNKKVCRALDRVNRVLLGYKREYADYTVHESISDLALPLMRLSAEMDRFLQNPLPAALRDTVMNFYFSVRNFLDIYEVADSNYIIYSATGEDGTFTVKLLCADPSANLQARLGLARSTIFFSATLLPIGYYKALLSTDPDNYAVYAQTSFTSDQRLLLIGRDVSSRYARRGPEEYGRIAAYIYKIATAKKGNYIAFFPSYKMMADVEEHFSRLSCGAVDVIMQEPGMGEPEREEFLGEFSVERSRSMAAFCVMGGIFGEGVDLADDLLIGAVIVGTGIPQIGGESGLLKDFFDARDGNGFDYVYRFPGMNRVQQAAGRVIRKSTDSGVIALLDDRFLQWENRRLFPREWDDWRPCTLSDVDGMLRDFWNCRLLKIKNGGMGNE